MNFNQPFDPGEALALILALCMIGLTDFQSGAALYGVQSAVLGMLAIYIGHIHHAPLLVLVGCAVVLLKGFAVPTYLRFAAHRLGCRRDGDMIVAPPLQLALALAGMSLLFLLRPLRDELSLSALPAVGIIMLGMMLMITRRLAVNQIVGFLVMENGIFLYTIAQPHTMPIMVEIGVLMDVLAVTMLAGLLVFRISSTFEHVDVAELTELRG